jgi:hypothetical protein
MSGSSSLPESERSRCDDSSLGLIRFAPNRTAANRRDVPGSRLLRDFLVGLSAKTNIARSLGVLIVLVLVVVLVLGKAGSRTY